jgi:arylsulfatase A-like enzyme
MEAGKILTMKIIILEADGLHLGYLGCYGAEDVDTAALDRLAAEGVVFDQHFADCPDAEPRTAWTGRYAFAPPETDHALLPDLLTRHGIAWEHVPRGEPFRETFAAASAALERLAASDRWLLWVELPSLAPPWDLDAEDLESYFVTAEGEEGQEPWLDPPTDVTVQLSDEDFLRLGRTYRVAVTIFDEELERWCGELRTGSWLDQVLLVVTARRGLALGEHDVTGVEMGPAHDELVHLPLVARFPGGEYAGRRLGALTQPVDWFPTLLDAFGLSVPEGTHGRSWWPLVRGEPVPPRPYACCEWDHAKGEVLLRTLEWANLPATQAHPPWLFRKPEDRWEVNDLLKAYQPWAEHLEQVLHDFVAACRTPGPLHEPELRDLETILQLASPTPGEPQP